MANDVLVESPEQIKLRQKLQSSIEKGNFPGTPEVEVEEDFMFRMLCKRGPTSSYLFFKVKGTFSKVQRKAEDLGRNYCQRFRLRFIWVEHFLIDINALPATETEQEN